MIDLERCLDRNFHHRCALYVATPRPARLQYRFLDQLRHHYPIRQNWGGASALLAAALPILISGGMHKPLLPCLIDSVSNLSYEIMYFCSTVAHNFAESGAAFAAAIRTKSEQRRNAAISGGTFALFGITEIPFTA